jgi:hypothetical protein
MADLAGEPDEAMSSGDGTAFRPHRHGHPPADSTASDPVVLRVGAPLGAIRRSARTPQPVFDIEAGPSGPRRPGTELSRPSRILVR